MNEVSTPSQSNQREYDDIMALVNRAQKGDDSAVPGIRELLKHSQFVDMLGGNLAKESQASLITKLCGHNLVIRESLTRKLDLLRSELAGTSSTPLERLLIERIVACWLHLHYLEWLCASQETMPLEQGNYFQRSISSTQKRYLSAIKSLAVVRKLAVPALQVNIAKKQVNVAGSYVTADSEGASKASQA